jgi:3-hydroxy-3-methylglutaryl CoA synthase
MVSLALFTIEMIARTNEKKKQSKCKSSKECNKSLLLNTKAFVGFREDLITLGVSRIEC